MREMYLPAACHAPQFEAIGYERFEVRPCTDALGAEISGVDLATASDNENLIVELRIALLNHLVIFFRDQSLSPEQQIALGRSFGDLHLNQTVKQDSEHPEILAVKQQADEAYNSAGNWHSDVSYEELPPMGTVLYALQIPECGGDTLFANMYLAYETLSDDVKAKIDGMQAVHSIEDSFTEFAIKHPDLADTESDGKAPSTSTHPVVRVHPETGRKSLFINEQSTNLIVGLPENESRHLIDDLTRHATKPDFTCRFRWTPGAVAFWDNRCTQHYASNDYPGRARTMHRVTILGDRPV